MYKLNNGQVFPFNWKQVYNLYNDKYSNQEQLPAVLFTKDEKEVGIIEK